MPPESDWVTSWLHKASADLTAAEQLLSNDPVLADIVCFHAQQAVEKLLKCLLVYHEVEFEKVHAIRYLMDLCCEIHPELEGLREQAEPLTRFAVQERYPMPGPTTTVGEAREAVGVAREVLAAVRRSLPDELTHI